MTGAPRTWWRAEDSASFGQQSVHLVHSLDQYHTNRNRETEHGEHSGELSPMFVRLGAHGVDQHHQDGTTGECLHEAQPRIRNVLESDVADCGEDRAHE